MDTKLLEAGLFGCFAGGSGWPVGRTPWCQRDEVGQTSAGPGSRLTGVCLGPCRIWNRERAKSCVLSLSALGELVGSVFLKLHCWLGWGWHEPGLL